MTTLISLWLVTNGYFCSIEEFSRYVQEVQHVEVRPIDGICDDGADFDCMDVDMCQEQ